MIVHPAVSAEVRNDNVMAADSSPEGSFLSVKGREDLQSEYSP